jgi:hypothetical protein
MKGSFTLACCIENVVSFRSYQQHTRTSWLSVPDSILSSILHARTSTFYRVYNGNPDESLVCFVGWYKGI